MSKANILQPDNPLFMRSLNGSLRPTVAGSTLLKTLNYPDVKKSRNSNMTKCLPLHEQQFVTLIPEQQSCELLIWTTKGKIENQQNYNSEVQAGRNIFVKRRAELRGSNISITVFRNYKQTIILSLALTVMLAFRGELGWMQLEKKRRGKRNRRKNGINREYKRRETKNIERNKDGEKKK